MLLLEIYAVRLNIEQPWVDGVKWQELVTSQLIEYCPTEASLNQVIEMIATKNNAYSLLQDESAEWINTFAEFKLITYFDDEICIYNIKCTLKPNTYLGESSSG